MSDDPGTAAAPKPFSLTLTLICAAVVAGGVGALAWVGSTNRAELLPAENSLELQHQTASDLDLLSALATVPAWERALHHATLGGVELSRLREWHEEWVASPDGSCFQLNLAILDAVDGRASAVPSLAASLRAAASTCGLMGDLLAATYLGEDVLEGDALVSTRKAVAPEPWFEEQLGLDWARRRGDRASEAATLSAREARLAPLLSHVRFVSALGALLMLLGACALGVTLVQRTRLLGGSAPLPPGWRIRDGLAVLARGGALGVVLIVALRNSGGAEPLDAALGPHGSTLVFWLLLYAPLTVFTLVRLLPLAGMSAGAAFGLRLRPGVAGRLLATGLIALAVAQFVTLVASAWGPIGWREWFSQEPPLADSGEVGWKLLNAVVLAPVLEELTWRALIFGTLRGRFGFWPAAILSAFAFTAGHGYAISDSLGVFAWGLALAWAYDRSRSLWPGIGAHALGNLLVFLQVWLL